MNNTDLLSRHGTPYAPLPQRLRQKALATNSNVRISARDVEVRAKISLAGAAHLQIIQVRVPSIAIKVYSKSGPGSESAS